ncbi:MAG TPA: hypothetical protein VN756_02525 [Solirubrobacterales bacterium]|nr:hypothetical protein [Solirubrobacterales bacterium]
MNEIQTPAEDDAKVEAAVLGRLLDLHPTHMTFDELVREVAADPEDFSQRDALERAVRDLGAAGLLHRSAGLIIASRAAVRFDELLG